LTINLRKVYLLLVFLKRVLRMCGISIVLTADQSLSKKRFFLISKEIYSKKINSHSARSISRWRYINKKTRSDLLSWRNRERSFPPIHMGVFLFFYIRWIIEPVHYSTFYALLQTSVKNTAWLRRQNLRLKFSMNISHSTNSVNFET